MHTQLIHVVVQQRLTQRCKAAMCVFSLTKPCLILCHPVDSSVHGQAPLSMGFSRWEYWSGLPCPSPGDLPNTGDWILPIPIGRQILYQ